LSCFFTSPPIEDELEKCLEAFHKAKRLSFDVIGIVLDNFSNVCYSLDAIYEASPQHFEEVSGLKEGQVLTMKKFVREWCGRIDDYEVGLSSIHIAIVHN
jgi:hypothetical protein